MRIYFSGAGGVGIGPAALIANDLGHEVFGSDVKANEITKQLDDAGIPVYIGKSDEDILKVHTDEKIDWLVYTPALPDDHPELIYAARHNIKATKRDEFVAHVLEEGSLKMIACSGTHGKTTTTAMLVWLFHKFKLPVTYAVGTSISWGPSGQYSRDSQYFIYEADEYDRHFLSFNPYSSIISSIDYDHPDTYPTVEEYKNAFIDFMSQSHCTFLWNEDAKYLGLDFLPTNCAHVFGPEDKLNKYKLLGEHNRSNAFLATQIFKQLVPEIEHDEIVSAINTFPGTKRRFEKLSNNIYTDYAHHPREIKSTIELAKEKHSRVAVVYQPHQNVRQVELLKNNGYGDCFDEADLVYWTDTYLTREDPDLDIVPAEKLVESVNARDSIEITRDMDALADKIKSLSQKVLVVIMGAGDIDDWAREHFLP